MIMSFKEVGRPLMKPRYLPILYHKQGILATHNNNNRDKLATRYYSEGCNPKVYTTCTYSERSFTSSNRLRFGDYDRTTNLESPK